MFYYLDTVDDDRPSTLSVNYLFSTRHSYDLSTLTSIIELQF